MALRVHSSGLAYSSTSLRSASRLGCAIGQVHVVIAMRQKRVAQRFEDTRLVAAEVVGIDQVQCRARLGLMLIVAVRVVPAAAIGHLLDRQAEEEEIFLACL